MLFFICRGVQHKDKNLNWEKADFWFGHQQLCCEQTDDCLPHVMIILR